MALTTFQFKLIKLKILMKIILGAAMERVHLCLASILQPTRIITVVQIEPVKGAGTSRENRLDALISFRLFSSTPQNWVDLNSSAICLNSMPTLSQLGPWAAASPRWTTADLCCCCTPLWCTLFSDVLRRRLRGGGTGGFLARGPPCSKSGRSLPTSACSAAAPACCAGSGFCLGTTGALWRRLLRRICLRTS